MADLAPSQLARLDGGERFSAGDATVLDFWRWALGDLRMNTARGSLAEFLVARALRSAEAVRIEWAAHDVSAAGIRVEVKSSGYLQSWGQRKRSVPRWGLTGAKDVWSPRSGSYESAPSGSRVDVWVFALHACTDSDAYDPLDVGQWRWWAAANATVEGCGQKSAGVAKIEELAGQPVDWESLDQAVAEASVKQAETTASSEM